MTGAWPVTAWRRYSASAAALALAQAHWKL